MCQLYTFDYQGSRIAPLSLILEVDRGTSTPYHAKETDALTRCPYDYLYALFRLKSSMSTMSTMSNDTATSLIEVFRDLYMFDLVLVGCACLTAYDTLLMFRSEVNLIWRAKWSGGKALYLACRYLPILNETLELIPPMTSGCSLTGGSSVHLKILDLWSFLDVDSNSYVHTNLCYVQWIPSSEICLDRDVDARAIADGRDEHHAHLVIRI
ncbi:hypothetical protein SCHPADRAFT_387583 [Schizopora paradoxa]|uniref:DUF6533 domain-containing protein n=1 Tax=Schizopora paradoxa TaxID=27342 RepID=A0A0H2RN20_9AGAM|nr:hypothetical protein SCHPADRAFT_387583 [Schizopora paradoxa]